MEDDTIVVPPPGSGKGNRSITVKSRLFGNVDFDNTLRESHVLVEIFNSADGVVQDMAVGDVANFLEGLPYPVTSHLMVNGTSVSNDSGTIDQSSDIEMD